jgi:hypothetical protein
METGEVYGGLGLPKIGDPTYVSFIDEQNDLPRGTGRRGCLAPEAPKEWTVLAPTPLVLMRSLMKPGLPT